LKRWASNVVSDGADMTLCGCFSKPKSSDWNDGCVRWQAMMTKQAGGDSDGLRHPMTGGIE